MKRIRASLLVIITFIGVLYASPHLSAQGPISIATDQPVYPIWKIGGNVEVTGSELVLNTTYYIWLQTPKDRNTTLTNLKLEGAPTATGELAIASTDPSGTYFLSLSESGLVDTRTAVTHFGVFGTDKVLYQRTESIVIAGGGFFPNSTVSVQLTNETASLEGFPSSITATARGEINYTVKISVSSEVGTWILQAAGQTFDNQVSASTTVSFQVEQAVMKFRLNYARTIERTALLTVNAIITYPDGNLFTSNSTGAQVNATLSATNFTRSQLMNYDATSLSWSAGFPIARNASLGQYTILVTANDAYGNAGKSTSYSTVIRAKLLFTVDPGVKVNPSTPVDVAVYVQYPDGSYLTDRVGGRVLAYTNSSGQAAYAMMFNGTDFKWHLTYTSPELGFTFGQTVIIYFNATDEYGNAGSAGRSFVIQVGADTGTIILSVVAAALVPSALLIWAILTISSRRRKYKP